eukprot:m.113385 g.113385  ORF g.113385 m.113385 type:complete len:943 (+) comp14130_c0_seq3:168-2996(+)
MADAATEPSLPLTPTPLTGPGKQFEFPPTFSLGATQTDEERVGPDYVEGELASSQDVDVISSSVDISSNPDSDNNYNSNNSNDSNNNISNNNNNSSNSNNNNNSNNESNDIKSGLGYDGQGGALPDVVNIDGTDIDLAEYEADEDLFEGMLLETEGPDEGDDEADDDDDLPPDEDDPLLQSSYYRLYQYVWSQSAEIQTRKEAVMHLIPALREGKEAFNTVCIAITMLCNDIDDEVKIFLVKQFHQLISEFTRLEYADRCTGMSLILQRVQDLICSPNISLRTMVRAFFMDLASHQIIDKDTLKRVVLNMVGALIPDEDDDTEKESEGKPVAEVQASDAGRPPYQPGVTAPPPYVCSEKALKEALRADALMLLGGVAIYFGEDFCIEHIIPRLHWLSKESSYEVRKLCPWVITQLCDMFSESNSTSGSIVLLELAPIFELLVKDPIWRVRKACADAITSLVQAVPMGYRLSHVCGWFVLLAKDESKWVRGAAFSIIGHFIASYAPEPPDDDVFERVSYDYKDGKVKRRSSVRANSPKKQIEGVETEDTEIDDMPDSNNETTCLEGEQGDEKAEFNSFNYWRVPVLEIDFDALTLEDDQSQEDVLQDPVSNAKNEGKQERDNEDDDDNNDDDDDFMIPEELVELYISMTAPESIRFINKDIGKTAAFSFPALVWGVGRNNWDKIKDCFQALADHEDWRVRGTLAQSMHVCAQILGREITDRDLLPVFDKFIRDYNKVHIGVLKHLVQFLQVVTPEKRTQYFVMLKQLQETEDDKNWRLRLALATQAYYMSPMCSHTLIIEELFPVIMQLAQTERVFDVRLRATEALAKLCSQVYKSEASDQTSVLLHKVSEMVHHTRFGVRICFVEFCGFIADDLPVTVFKSELLEFLKLAAQDKVANVRLVAARVVSWLAEKDVLKAELCDTLEALKNDKDQDVVSNTVLEV